MADNFDKLWVQQSLNSHATNRASQVIQATGRALPCHVTAVSGQIVTVVFDVTGPWTLPPLKLPKAESPWIRVPTQIGDKGMTVPADTFLGGISGLGSGVADLTRVYGNMATLVFVPVASVNSPAVNVNAAYVSGPAGAVIQTADGTASISVSTSGITLSFGGKSVVINSSGVTIDGILWDTHVHGGVTTGGGDTSGPV